MNIIDILQSVRGNYTDLRRVTEKDIDIIGSVEAYRQCRQIITEAGGDPNNIFVSDGAMNNVFYIEKENGLYVVWWPFNPEYAEMIKLKENLPGARQTQKEALVNQDYLSFYFRIPTQLLLYDFLERYKEIPDEKFIETWEYVYTSTDFYFSNWKKEILDRVYKLAPRSDSDEFITIYRGEGKNATPHTKAYSWTTDLNTALWFATRWEGHSVWKAKVRKNNVAIFIDGNEHEAIVNPKYVERATKLPMYKADRDTLVDMLGNVADDFKYYGQMIADYYPNENELHDKNHVARVLLFSLLIAYEMNLMMAEVEMIAVASIMHDCGRKTDSSEKGHGKASAKIFRQSEDMTAMLGDSEIKIVDAIIRCHDIDDSDGVAYIKKNIPEEDIDTALLLYKILKDADALDRYRLDYYRNEFDYDMLRLEEARKMVLLSAGYFKGKVEEVIWHSEEDA